LNKTALLEHMCCSVTRSHSG